MFPQATGQPAFEACCKGALNAADVMGTAEPGQIEYRHVFAPDRIA